MATGVLQSRYRRIGCALGASGVLHLLALWLSASLPAPGQEPSRFQVHTFRRPQVSQRFETRPAAVLSRPLLQRLRSDQRPQDLAEQSEADFGLAADSTAEGLSDPPLPQGLTPAAEKSSLAPVADSLQGDLHLGLDLPDRAGALPVARDLVALDAERRYRNIALIDPQTGKLQRAYLHLPVYMNNPEGCTPHLGQEVDEALNLMRRGFAVSQRVPIVAEVDWVKIGGAIDDISIAYRPLKGFPGPDPLHTYVCNPQRRVLHASEMAHYSVLMLRHIDVQSAAVLIEYLRQGGFVVTNGRRQLDLLEEELLQQEGVAVEPIQIALGHPLFHSFFDIKKYRDPNALCRYGVRPLAGITVDGRLAAVEGIGFVTTADCPANQLYANTIAFGLIQPSKMGGRYLARPQEGR